MAVFNISQKSRKSLNELPQAERVQLLAAKLSETLGSSTVLTPDSDGYAASIQRWSDAVEMRAVSRNISYSYVGSLKTFSC
jgi:hypothetical protein